MSFGMTGGDTLFWSVMRLDTTTLRSPNDDDDDMLLLFHYGKDLTTFLSHLMYAYLQHGVSYGVP